MTRVSEPAMLALGAIVEPVCACGGLLMLHLGLMARTCRWETPHVKDAQRQRVGEVMRRHLPNAALAQRLEQNFDITHSHYNIPRGPGPYWRVWVDGKPKTFPVIVDDLLSIDSDEARLASLFAALQQNRLRSTVSEVPYQFLTKFLTQGNLDCVDKCVMSIVRGEFTGTNKVPTHLSSQLYTFFMPCDRPYDFHNAEVELYKYFLDVAETSKAAADLGMEVDVQYAKRFFCNIACRYLDRSVVPRRNLTPLAEAWDNVHGAGEAQ